MVLHFSACIIPIFYNKDNNLSLIVVLPFFIVAQHTKRDRLTVQINKLRLDVLLLKGCCIVAECFCDGVAI